MLKTVDFYGINVIGSNKKEVMEDLLNSIGEKQKKIVFGVGASIGKFSRLYPWYPEFLNTLDLVLFDGRGLYYTAKVLGYKVPCGMSIPEYVQASLDAVKQINGRVYLLGATQENNNAALNKLRDTRFSVAGHHGYFNQKNKTEMTQIFSDIEAFEPNLLLIGMSSPLKEKLCIEYRKQFPLCVIVLCGGMIDVISGETKQTPMLMKRFGLAWLYRIIQEPNRLFRSSMSGLFEYLFCTVPRMLINRKDNRLPKLKSREHT